MTSTPQIDPQRPCWFVGAAYGGTDDQATRFLRDGIWENGWGMNGDKRFDHLVNAMQTGDRIAIKKFNTPMPNPPFPTPKQPVLGGMYILAVGTVKRNPRNGRYVEVNWTWSDIDSPREWYFSQYLQTIHRVVQGEDWKKDALIAFTFDNKPQDIDRFRNDPQWRDKFGDPLAAPNIAPPTVQHPAAETGESDDAADDDTPESYTIDDIIADGCFLERDRLHDIIQHWQSKKNLILQGPPGTGKTWLARKLAYALIGQRDETQVQAVQFHPNLSYEDFVRGWRPSSDGKLDLMDGPFLKMVDAARQDPNSDYVIVIEEINRGNPAQVFGEMLTLLESDKRKESEALSLSYRRSDGERIYIPANLYLIGTMNIADRSLALVDLAFRRRFAFEDLEPIFNRTWLEWGRDNCGLDAQSLTNIQQRMLALNQQIAADRTLGRQFRVGHSYVTPAPGNVIPDTAGWFRRIVEKEIAPLLEEYWFDKPEAAQQAKSALLAGM